MAASPEASAGVGHLPRDAASLVIVDGSGGTSKQRVLLGKRRESQTFAPGYYVFPGGGLDSADTVYDFGQRLPDHDRVALSYDRGPRSLLVEPEAFALAAIRETFEETGLVVGCPCVQTPANAPNAWQPFLAHGMQPNVGALSFIARAITPPGRSRRFDARFFLAEAVSISHHAQTNDGEFEETLWVDFEAARSLNLHGMTRSILEEAERFLVLPQAKRMSLPVPFFSQGQDGWQRSHIMRSQTFSKT